MISHQDNAVSEVNHVVDATATATFFYNRIHELGEQIYSTTIVNNYAANPTDLLRDRSPFETIFLSPATERGIAG